MIRSFAVTLIALVMLGVLAVPVQANSTSTSGTLTGTSTSTPTANPAVFDSSFAGSGVDSVSGPFTGTNMGVLTFTSPTTFITSGTFVDVFPDGTVFGTFSGSGTETGGGNTNITFVTLITGGTGIFAGDTGESTVTGTSTATSSTTSSFTGSYTGIVTTPEPSSQTTYSYTGHAYNQFGGTFACPPVCGIAGSFTVAAPLGPNQRFLSFTPLSFSFTDGLTTFTPSSVTGSVFQVVTNSFGQIIGWNMDWLTPGDEMFSGTNPPGCVGCRVVDGSFDIDTPNFAEINNTPGKWTASTSMGPFAYVADNSASDLFIVNTSTNLVVGAVPIGGPSFSVAVSPNGAFVYDGYYVPSSGNDFIAVVSTSTNLVTATIPLAGGATSIAFSPDGSLAYAALGNNSVAVINTSTNAVVASVSVGASPEGIALTPNGAFAYVVDSGNTNQTGNTVSVIDTTSRSVVATIPVGVNPIKVAITPNGASAYVTNANSASVSVISASTNAVTATIPVGAVPRGVVISPDGAFAYVANGFSNSVSVIDTASNTVTATIPTVQGGAGDAITPDGRFVYVSVFSSGLSVIDTSNNTVVATIPVGEEAIAVAIASTPASSQSITQTLSPTAPNTFNFGPHNFTVQYPAGTSFSGVNMTVVAAQATQQTFKQRVSGTTFANAVCVVYSGTGGNCVDYQVTCSNTGGSKITCPSESTPTITVKTSYDTLQSITNPGFLTTPIGTNNWTNIFDSFFLQRIDPTTKGRTSGFSEFVAVDLGATNSQGAGTLQFLAPLQSNDERIFPVGTSIPVSFKLTSLANPGVPVSDAIAGITVVMVSDASGNPTTKLVLEKAAAFVFSDGNYVYSLNTTGYTPGVYNVTVYGNAFVAQQVQFTLPAPTTGARISTTLLSLTLNTTTQQYVAVFKMTNTGTGAANGLTTTASVLNSTSSVTSLPVSLGDVNPGSSIEVTLSFPVTAGASNSRGEITISESYAGGTAGGGFRVTLP